MLLWVVPERRAGRTAPVIIAHGALVGRDPCLPPHRETDAEAVAGSRQIGCGSGADLPQMVDGHERDRCWAQDAVAVEGAAVLQHLQEFRVIEGCGNHALAACFPFGGKPRVADRRGAYDLIVS